MRIWVVVLSLVLMTGCAHNVHNQGSAPASINVDPNTESELGALIHSKILSFFPLCQEKSDAQWVKSVVARLAAQTERKDIPYQFTILDDERIYATHAPGGYIYLTKGLVRFVKNEGELAGILAYEIARLQYKDPRLTAGKRAMDMLVKTGATVGPAFGPIGSLSALGLVALDAIMSREKGAETQIANADKKALQYLAAAGYPPQSLAQVLSRMNQPQMTERAFLYDYLQSHPVTPERLGRLTQAL